MTPKKTTQHWDSSSQYHPSPGVCGDEVSLIHDLKVLQHILNSLQKWNRLCFAFCFSASEGFKVGAAGSYQRQKSKFRRLEGPEGEARVTLWCLRWLTASLDSIWKELFLYQIYLSSSVYLSRWEDQCWSDPAWPRSLTWYCTPTEDWRIWSRTLKFTFIWTTSCYITQSGVNF